MAVTARDFLKKAPASAPTLPPAVSDDRLVMLGKGSPANGQVARWNAAAAAWLPASGGLSGLTDVSVGTPSDGLAVLFQGSSGLWVAGVPVVSGKEIIYAENATGTATTSPVPGAAPATGATIDIPGAAITIPANVGPVYIEGGGYGQQSVIGIGQATLKIIETTGAATDVAFDTRSLPNSTAAQSKTMGWLRPRVRLGAVATARTFKLSLYVQSTSGTPQFLVPNAGSLGLASYLRAWAE